MQRTMVCPMLLVGSLGASVSVTSNFQRTHTNEVKIIILHRIVNDVEKGQGQGTSKQLAKEAAAKIAYHGMGWGEYY